MKKSQTKSKSSVKTVKLSAKKKAGTPLKAAEKTLKKPSRPKAEIKKGTGAKASAPRGVAKKVKPTSASPSKPPLKKSLAGKAAKPSIRTDAKKPLKTLKKPPAKLSRPKAKTKPAAAAAVPKAKKLPKAPVIKKTVASEPPVKKPQKSSEKITKTKSTAGKETAKTISAAKTLTPGRKPAKKSPARPIAPAAKITKKKTVKPIGAKKPSAKVKKVAAGKPEGKIVKSLKVAATAESSAKTKKSTAKEQKPVPEKKSLPAKTAPQIKAPVKQKAILKTIEKEGALLSPGRKTIKKKGTSSLAPSGPSLDTGKKAIQSHIAVFAVPSQTETRQNKQTRLKVFLPEEELPPEEVQEAPSPKLPEEFGENELLLMEVDPAIVFVSWEIKPDCISCKTGKLDLRVYDVTGLEFDGSNAGKFFDIALSKRVDSKFIDIRMPGRDVIMEIGLLQPDGAFEAIKRSNRVSMPALLTLEEFGISGSLFGLPNTLIGY